MMGCGRWECTHSRGGGGVVGWEWMRCGGAGAGGGGEGLEKWVGWGVMGCRTALTLPSLSATARGEHAAVPLHVSPYHVYHPTPT